MSHLNVRIFCIIFYYKWQYLIVYEICIFDPVFRNTCTALSQSEWRNVYYYKSYTWQNNKRIRSSFEVNHRPGLHNNNNNSIIVIIIYMTRLLQSDWLRGVQLIIFVVTGGGGGEREIKTTKNPIWRRN